MITHERLHAGYHYDPETGAWSRPLVAGSRGRPKGGRRIGWRNDQGYWIITIDERRYRTSHLAWLWMTGSLPADEIDHIDLDKGNDRWANLREATHAENTRNCRLRKHSLTGVKGVQLHKQSGMYRGRITINGECIHLGLFTTAALAHEAYTAASQKYHGEYGRIT